MNWYKGNISEAVSLSKTKNAIFVVYVEGKDEATVKLGNIIDDVRIREKLESDDFVAIKIKAESDSYMQFASIYQIVPVPSIFFIGKSGTPLDIATGVLKSVDELDAKVAKVLLLAGKKPAASLAANDDFIREESKASNTVTISEPEEVKKEHVTEKSCDITEEIVCEDGVCYKKSKEPVQENKTEEQANQSKQNDEEKIAETRKYLEQKRLERVEKEKLLEKERELQRRKQGKDMQNLRAWQQDHELKELKENIKREKLEEQAARERIRAQIAADKAERVHKFTVDAQAATSKAEKNANALKNTNTSTVIVTDESRIQFRLASGANNSQNFKYSTTLAEIRDYVTRELLPGTGIKEFSLATTYPKRELTSEHDAKTLTELELFPSAVVLIIGKEATGPSAIISRNGGLLNMMSILLMTVLNPIFSLFTSAKNWLSGVGNRKPSVQTGPQKRASEDQNDISTKRHNIDRFINSGTGNTTGTSTQSQDVVPPGTSQQTVYSRFAGGSNIHRLSDNRKDSDDENATWNGNSTQQQ